MTLFFLLTFNFSGLHKRFVYTHIHVYIFGGLILLILSGTAIQEQQQAGATDEAEPFMGSGRFGTKFSMSYYWQISLNSF